MAGVTAAPTVSTNKQFGSPPPTEALEHELDDEDIEELEELELELEEVEEIELEVD